MNKKRIISIALVIALFVGVEFVYAAGNKMTNYPNGFPGGVTLRNLPAHTVHPGHVYWVDSQTGGDGNPGTFGKPFATIDAAIGHCTANRGDEIWVKSGHSEYYDASSELDFDVAGVRIIGVGNGRNRPWINISGVTTFIIEVAAANCSLENLVFDFTSPDDSGSSNQLFGDCVIYVNAADFRFVNNEIIMTDTFGQCYSAMSATTEAHRMLVDSNYISGSTNTGGAKAIQFHGAPRGVRITNNIIEGDYSNAALYSHYGDLFLDMLIQGNIILNRQASDHAIEFLGAGTGWIIKNFILTDAVATSVDPGSMSATWNSYYDTTANTSDASGTTRIFSLSGGIL